MDVEISVQALPLLGVCNLCLNEGAVKSMLMGYNHNGNIEIYSEMLFKCFAIDLTQMEFTDTKRLICKLCINKLRDSVTFREQVETSLQTLQAVVNTNRMYIMIYIITHR
ncbi:hypothetical protein O3G_MSEX011875 [Manduca sexta]|uniref:ZAD domain-containing protein n=1 Tax=Manduca sexta TaxID=7130 RepID=A0A922CWA3_MANSE|nr:hypothetical protein O3G_MSEX011875 [Manduca sexta]